MKRRPTAEDRDLAEWIHGLAPGRYNLDVEDLTVSDPRYAESGLRYLGIARLKRKGSLVIDDTQKRIEIYPGRSV